MTELSLSVAEPFTSPAWGANFVVFSSDLGEPVAESASKDYISKACKYAKHYEVYLVPERFFLQGYQCMCLISPQGKVLGAQQAAFCNLTLPPHKRGVDLDVFTTEFGGIFLCVDADIYHPEIPRVAWNMGAQFVICSQRVQRDHYDTYLVLSGCWSAAQSNGLYVVDACNQFHCVCAPRALTPHRDGFLIAPSRKTPMTTKLDGLQLAQCQTQNRLNRKFYAVHREELCR